MAPPSRTNSRSSVPDTPAPDTGVVRAIRASIQPRTGFWQFELRPWHYVVSISSTAVCFAGVVLVLLAHAGAR